MTDTSATTISEITKSTYLPNVTSFVEKIDADTVRDVSLARMAELKDERARLQQLVRETEDAMTPHVRYFVRTTSGAIPGKTWNKEPTVIVSLNDKDDRDLFFLERKYFDVSAITALIGLLKGPRGGDPDYVLGDSDARYVHSRGVLIWREPPCPRDGDGALLFVRKNGLEYSFRYEWYHSPVCPPISVENLIEVLEAMLVAP